MRRLGLLLCLLLAARAGDETPVVRIHDATDLETDVAWWAITVARARAAVADTEATTTTEGYRIVVRGTPTVQDRVTKALGEVREAYGNLVVLHVYVVKLKGPAGVASVPADKVEEFLKTHAGYRSACLVCRNGVVGTLESTQEVTYVADFDIGLDAQGHVTADPVVSTIQEGFTLKARPLDAKATRVATEFTVTDVVRPIPAVDLPLPLSTPVQVQVPESESRTVARVVTCVPDTFAVIELGGSRVALLRAWPVKASNLEGTGKDEEPQPKGKPGESPK